MGILEVKLIQAQGLENKDLIGKSDPFAKLYIRQLHSMIQTSKVIDNHLNPIWNEHFEFVIEDASTQNLTVEIHDQDRLQTSELIGCAQVKLSELDPGKVKDVWLKLVKDLDVHRDNEDKGNVHLELLYCPDGAGNEFINPFTSNLSMTLLEKVMKDGSGVENGDLVDKKTRVLITKGVLSVTVKSGEDLPPADLMGKADPFVVLTMKKTGNKNKTRLMGNILYYYGMCGIIKELLLIRYFSKEVRGGAIIPETEIVHSCRKLLSERHGPNVLNFLEAMNTRPDITEGLKRLQCRSLIFVGENSPFNSDSLHMTSKLDRRFSALVEVQGCGSMVTEEQPDAMLIPLEYFLMGFGFYRPSQMDVSPRSPLSPSSISPELYTPESMGLKLKPIKTRHSHM